MKLDNFLKYKHIVETENLDSFREDKDAMQVYEWLNDSGRLNETILGSIWKWIKKNFSPTSLKLHKLADEYAVELEKEIRAEHDSKGDIADAIRNSTRGGDLSDLIKQKMYTVAEDDVDYKELASSLINLKTYEIQNQLIAEYEGKFSNTSKSGKDLAKLKAEVEENGKIYHAEYQKANAKAGAEDKAKGKALSEMLHKETEKSPANKVIKNKIQATMAIEGILAHMLKHHSKNINDKNFDLTTTNAKNLLDSYVNIVDKNYRSIMSEFSVDEDTAKKELRKKTVDALVSDNIKDFNEKFIVEAVRKTLKKDEPANDSNDDSSDSPETIANKLTRSEDLATKSTKKKVGEENVNAAIQDEVKDVIADMQADNEKISKQKVKDKILEDAKKFFKNKQSRFSSVPVEKYESAVEAFLVHYGAIVATDSFDFADAATMFKQFVKKEGYAS